MNDYRRAKRRKADLTIDILDTMTESSIGKMSNLSETGMLLILHEPLMSDALYQLRFRIGDSSGVERTIEVGAHELWSDDAAAPGQCWTGFRFIDIAPADLAYMREWVDAPGSQYV